MIKQVIVMRNDLNMRKGKMIAQGSHASMAFLTRNSTIEKDDIYTTLLNPSEVNQWIENGFTKICLQVNSEEELDNIQKKAEEAGLIVNMIIDKGLTEFNGVKTKTCLAIGPNKIEEIDKITGNLRLL